jgi:hypothetical protein
MTHADLIVVNAHIATLDPNAPEASAMAVRDGKVVGVGSVESLHDAFNGPNTRVVDMGGATVMPGLHDAHNHHQIAGKGDLMEIEFLPTASLDQIVEMIRAYALELPEGAWVVGGSWGSTLIAELSEADAKDRIDEAADTAAVGRQVGVRRFVHVRDVPHRRIDEVTALPAGRGRGMAHGTSRRVPRATGHRPAGRGGPRRAARDPRPTRRPLRRPRGPLAGQPHLQHPPFPDSSR